MSSFYIETLFCRDVKKVWWTGLMREGRERGLVEIMCIEGNSGYMKIYKIY
jgi:hypothetical protein